MTNVILKDKSIAVPSQLSLSVANGRVEAVVPIARMPCASQLRLRSQSLPWVMAVALVIVSLSVFYSFSFAFCVVV